MDGRKRYAQKIPAWEKVETLKRRLKIRTDVELCRRAGIDYHRYWAFMSGRTQSVDTAKAIRRALQQKITLDELFRGWKRKPAPRREDIE